MTLSHTLAQLLGGSVPAAGDSAPPALLPDELLAALSGLSHEAAPGLAAADDDDDENDSDPRAAAGLWDEMLDAACDLTDAEPAQNGAQQSSCAALDSLNKHLERAYPDESLRTSMMTALADILAAGRGDDEVSAQLAETLGWEQLDLVEVVMGDRQRVLQGLRPPQDDTHVAAAVDHFQHQSFAAPAVEERHTASSGAYLPRAQMTFQTAEDVAEQKRQRAEARRAARHRNATGAHAEEAPLSLAEMERMREAELAAAASRPLFTSNPTGARSEPQYPHVFSSGAQGNILSAMGQKFALPAGTTREQAEFWEEVTIPPPKQLPFRSAERLIPINEMPPMFRAAFPGYASLNRLQSAVFPLGFQTNENLLVCAPTGAGKTDVAMLTVLRCISLYAAEAQARSDAGQRSAPGVGQYGIRMNEFKIIYVAPMKALAAEIVRKFGKRLAYLGIKVRELTGDMQLTRQEIAETQMIVTTPEKWDVVTRKPTGEGELASKVKLLIIDEVHLLHEDRGAVIETIVARTLRLVESSQSLIRIVGLSATLPNYVDVADFLRVNRMQGLFYFDSSFRPVPLEQHFIGVKGKAGSPTARGNLDKAVFSKVQQLLAQGHQLMIFVHARKETVKTAMTMRDMCRDEGIAELLMAGREGNVKLDGIKRDLLSSRNKELKELFESGLGIHHAGMLRSDRNLSERAFESGLTRILCCTSTLAWGVNLPAYAVLIKGTEVYDSSVGKFVDLSILDVLQIFGRAGRPQYEDLGVGYICTNQDKLTHYIDAITSQHPIESKFITGLVDSLNAEVALGTVNSLDDGQTWLSYTYMFTRMKRNPLGYGMAHTEVADDPHLGAKRLQLIQSAARRLVACKMLELDEAKGRLIITDLGRVAAKYYIPNRTVEIFNEKLRPHMSEADVLSVLSLATDFEQIIPRDNEEKELKRMQENAPCEVPGGFGHSPGKVNVLLQAYISKVYIEDFALVSDSAYVAQNAGRIIRALLEVALSRKWAPVTAALMSMSKAVERRMWPFEHPLSVEQSKLSPDTVYNITRWADDVDVATLASMSAAEIGTLIHLNERQGGFVRQAARHFPVISADYALRPLTHDLLRIVVDVSREFEWSERLHGSAEPFLIWVEEETGVEILQSHRLLLRPQAAKTSVSFVVSVPQPLPAGMTVRWISDRWLGAEDQLWLPFDELVMPSAPPAHLALADVPLLQVGPALGTHVVEPIYSHRFKAFNAIQTQVFHSMMHSRADALLCAPSASGKSTMSEMAIWRALREDRLACVLVLHPQRTLSLAHADAFRNRFADLAGLAVRSARWPRDLAPPSPPKPTVVYATPPCVVRALSEEGHGVLEHFNLVIVEDVHLLDAPLELLLSKMRRVLSREHTRLVVTSASLADASGLQEWLHIKPAATFSFHPSDSPSPLRISFQSFDLPHSVTLLKAMAKPAYDRMKAAVASGPALVFVPSRAQCLGTATDLSTRSATDMETESFLRVDVRDLEPLFDALSDRALVDPLLHGIGVWHEGMSPRDQALMLDLYDQGAIRVLVVSRDACWTLPARAHLVVIMSTQYVRLMPPKADALGSDRKIDGLSDRRLTDYSLPELVRMSSFAVRPGAAVAGECAVMCQGDQVAYLQRMLSSGLPLESSLHEDRAAGLLAPLLLEVSAGRVTTPAALVDLLSWTYLARQAQHNPSYYDCGADMAASLSDIADSLFDELEAMRCVVSAAGSAYQVTPLGQSLARDSFAFSDLVSLHRAASADATLAGRIATSLKHGAEPAADEAGAAAEAAVLDATRATIPGEWLAAANVPRLPRRGAAASAPAVDGDAASASSEAALTPAQRRALLLVAYFACRPIGGAKTDAVHRGARERLQDEQAALVRALLRMQHNNANGRRKGK